MNVPPGGLSPRARAGLGMRSRVRGRVPGGPAGRGAGAGSLEVLLPRKGALGLGGHEFALRVMGEKDSDCCRGGKPCSCLMGYNDG
jgi:hypothetical protein